MEQSEAIELLSLYNARAAKLHGSSFLQYAREGRGNSFTMHAGPFRAVRDDTPNLEAVEAFLYTFRLFIQDRDGLSFREMERLYDSLPIASSFRDEVQRIRSEVNEYLDGLTPLRIYDTDVTRRELLHNWLYGHSAHLNPDKRRILKEWGVGEDVQPL